MSVARHYDVLDRFYREIWGEHVHHGLWLTGDETPQQAVLNLVERVGRLLDLAPGAAVCDIGCGYGGTARRLAEFPGCAVVGVTLSQAQLAWAREFRPTANPRLMVMDWLANDFPPMSFDAVLAIESSEHMVDQPRFFAEIRRTLKPGGRFVLCAWLAAEAPSPMAVRHLLEPICREGALPQLGTETEYRAMMAAAGLEIQSYEDLTQRVRRTWWIILKAMVAGLFRDRSYLRFLLDRRNPDRFFALGVVRILLAYRWSAMKYGLFVATAAKPF
jgi:tocopherol O-methyltransferase